ncbi:TolC family protein [Bacillota bacterium LX-D]|nr:TolC family protein [Bacillota bacterium LX-D]
MKKKRQIALLLVSLFLMSIMLSGAAVAESGQMQLTLDQALDLAVKNNHQMELDKLSVEKAKLQLEEAKYSAKKYKDEYLTTLDLAKLKYVVPISAEMNLLIAENKARVSTDSLKLEVEKNYYEMLKQQAALKNAQTALTRANEQLKLTQSKYKAGVAAQSDVIADEVKVANQEAAVFQAQNSYDKAKVAMAKSLGLSLDTSFEPVTKFTYNPAKIDLAAEIERGLKNNVEVIAAQETIKVAEATFEQTKKYYPSIVFAYRQAEFDVANSKAQYTNTKANAELKIRQAYFDMLSAEKAYKTLETSLKNAQETYRVAALRYKAGVATRIEMEMAADSLHKQEDAVMEALYTYNLAAAQFRYGLFF